MSYIEFDLLNNITEDEDNMNLFTLIKDNNHQLLKTNFVISHTAYCQ